MDIDKDLFHSLIFAPSSSGHLPASPITTPYLPLLFSAPMGSVSLNIGDGTAHFHCAMLCSSALQLLMLASTIFTNLFALYAFLFSPSPSATIDVGDHKNLFVISEHISLILREIEVSESWLHQIERELTRYETLNPAKSGLPLELKLILACHPLPLGRNSCFGITTMVSFVTHSCACPITIILLFTSMSNYHTASCPTVDPLFLSKLISKACEPLPHHRRPRPPPSPISLEPQCQEPPSILWVVPGWHTGRALLGTLGQGRSCQAGTWAVPCLACLGHASPGLGHVVLSLVCRTNFSNPA